MKKVNRLNDLEQSNLDEIRASAERIKIQDYPILAVHSTDYFPENETITSGGESARLVDRRTVHFGLNGIARAAFLGVGDNWEKRKYHIVAPLADLIDTNSFIGGCTVDSMFPSGVRLPQTTTIFEDAQIAGEYIDKMASIVPFTYNGLRRLGKRAWSGTRGYDVEGEDGRELMNSLGVYFGTHFDHWTNNYEWSRMNGLTEQEAIDNAITPDINWILTKFPGSTINDRTRAKKILRIKDEIKMLGYKMPRIFSAKQPNFSNPQL